MYIWHTISTLKEGNDTLRGIIKNDLYEKIESLEQELEQKQKEHEKDRDEVVDKLFDEKSKCEELRTELKFSNWQKNYNAEKHAEKSFRVNDLEKELEYTQKKLGKKEEVVSCLLEYIHNKEANRKWGVVGEEVEVIEEIEADLETERAQATGKVL